MSTITPVALQQRFAARPDLVLLDVRTPAEFDEVHVPQARLEPLDRFQSEATIAALGLPKDQPLHLLCRSGARAAQAAAKLQAAGYEPVVVEGGTLAWIKAGLPVVRGERKVIGLERQVRIAAGALVLTGVILSLTVHRGFIGLSGFVGAGLVFAGITDWCGMGLLLAKAPWNQRRPS
ncbi:rhodanese-like domain-containing protein [Luteolibacter sp. LG18]|uniref:rhodanese-like domain-containing protein n=1 Tax=Luteolibacter sp. LG18 TaxID=2819286 RepID=UPI002B301177|nr:sulfurtransferase [Luteolibacter sp. LG18]